MSKHNFFEHNFVLLLLLAVVFTMFGSFVPVKTREARITQLKWETRWSVLNDYLRLNCAVDPCKMERETETIDSRSRHGTGREVSWPEPFDMSAYPSDYYQEADSWLYVDYVDERLKVRTQRIHSLDDFRSNYTIGHSCLLRVSLFGIVVSDNCVGQGR